MSEDKSNYIDNAVLFFIFNKIDSINESDLITICKEFYNSDEIDLAKSITFDVYNKSEEKINRKGNNKTNSDIQDIIRIIRLNTLPDKVKFCVTTCTRLPPVGLDYIDAGALIKQVTELRFQIINLSSLSKEVTLLKKDITYLKSINERHQNKVPNNELSKSPNVREIVEKLDQQLKPTTICNNNNSFVEDINTENIEAIKKIDSNSSINNNTICEHVKLNKNNIYPNITELQSECLAVELQSECFATEPNNKINNINSDDDSSIVSDKDYQDFKNFIKSYKNYSPAKDNISSKYKKSRVFHNKGNNYHNTYNEAQTANWTRRPSGNSILHNWRTQTSNYGPASNFLTRSNSFYPVQKHRLRAAIGTLKRSWDLFITRVDPTESEETVYEHLKDIVGEKGEVEVFKIRSKYNSYSSFRATVKNINRNLNLLDSSYWPSGILVKVFK